MMLLIAASLLFVALSAADLLLTLELQKLGAIERNPLLGKRPSPRKLIIFSVVTTVAWLGAAVFFVLKDVPGAPFVFALGIALRLMVVVKGYQLRRKMRARG